LHAIKKNFGSLFREKKKYENWESVYGNFTEDDLNKMTIHHLEYPYINEEKEVFASEVIKNFW
jgi:hypothetical protein